MPLRFKIQVGAPPQKVFDIVSDPGGVALENADGERLDFEPSTDGNRIRAASGVIKVFEQPPLLAVGITARHSIWQHCRTSSGSPPPPS